MRRLLELYLRVLKIPTAATENGQVSNSQQLDVNANKSGTGSHGKVHTTSWKGSKKSASQYIAVANEYIAMQRKKIEAGLSKEPAYVYTNGIMEEANVDTEEYEIEEVQKEVTGKRVVFLGITHPQTGTMGTKSKLIEEGNQIWTKQQDGSNSLNSSKKPEDYRVSEV